MLVLRHGLCRFVGVQRRPEVLLSALRVIPSFVLFDLRNPSGNRFTYDVRLFKTLLTGYGCSLPGRSRDLLHRWCHKAAFYVTNIGRIARAGSEVLDLAGQVLMGCQQLADPHKCAHDGNVDLNSALALEDA